MLREKLRCRHLLAKQDSRHCFSLISFPCHWFSHFWICPRICEGHGVKSVSSPFFLAFLFQEADFPQVLMAGSLPPVHIYVEERSRTLGPGLVDWQVSVQGRVRLQIVDTFLPPWHFGALPGSWARGQNWPWLDALKISRVLPLPASLWVL